MMMPNKKSVVTQMDRVQSYGDIFLLKDDEKMLRDGVECHGMVLFHICKSSRLRTT